MDTNVAELPEREQTIGFMLNEYLSKLNPHIREDVFAKVMKTRIIADAYAKPEGKVLLDGPIREMQTNITQMIEMLIKGDIMEKKKREVLDTYANNAKVRWEYLVHISNIVVEGENHLKKATKKRGVK